MKVAAVQFKGDRVDPRRGLRRLAAIARRAAVGADLIVLPEMAHCGYIFADAAAVRAVAEPADGPTATALAAVAREAGCWLVAGFAEEAGQALFNSARVFDPRGALRFVYRKTLLFEEDEHWATPGDSGYRRFDTDAGSFGVGICMDLNDDDFVSWCAGADLDAIAFPTNWLEQGIDVWNYWSWRLQGVSAALVAANTFGREDTVTFCGRSAVVQGLRVLAAAPPTGEAIIRAMV